MVTPKVTAFSVTGLLGIVQNRFIYPLYSQFLRQIDEKKDYEVRFSGLSQDRIVRLLIKSLQKDKL